LDPENARIKEFLIESSDCLPPGSILLDAGAGKKPYKKIFKECKYESTDMPGGFYCEPHDFECFLDNIPRADNFYDAVVLTQVLEHVPDPWQVLREVKRILKPHGRLILSVPFEGPLYGEPWHFYQFTHYALRKMAEETGFNVISLEKIGGSFWVLGKRFPMVILKLFKQRDPFRSKKRKQSILFDLVMNLAMFPLFLFLYLPSAYLMRPIFYWLDRLDKDKELTLGYTAVFEKR